MNPDAYYDFGFARVALTIDFHSSSLPDGSTAASRTHPAARPSGEKIYIAGYRLFWT
jgi:hypothetical protein